MFVKVQDPTFASALNISKFDTIVVHRVNSGYALSIANLPLSDINAYQRIATFTVEQQAKAAFDNLMVAIADGENYWSLD